MIRTFPGYHQCLLDWAPYHGHAPYNSAASIHRLDMQTPTFNRIINYLCGRGDAHTDLTDHVTVISMEKHVYHFVPVYELIR